MHVFYGHISKHNFWVSGRVTETWHPVPSPLSSVIQVTLIEGEAENTQQGRSFSELKERKVLGHSSLFDVAQNIRCL
jgi:hypothetical protein